MVVVPAIVKNEKCHERLGALTTDTISGVAPHLSPVTAVLVLVFNILLPGLGTLISSCLVKEGL